MNASPQMPSQHMFHKHGIPFMYLKYMLTCSIYVYGMFYRLSGFLFYNVKVIKPIINERKNKKNFISMFY